MNRISINGEKLKRDIDSNWKGKHAQVAIYAGRDASYIHKLPSLQTIEEGVLQKICELVGLNPDDYTVSEHMGKILKEYMENNSISPADIATETGIKATEIRYYQTLAYIPDETTAKLNNACKEILRKRQEPKGQTTAQINDRVGDSIVKYLTDLTKAVEQLTVEMRAVKEETRNQTTRLNTIASNTTQLAKDVNKIYNRMEYRR